MYDIFGKVGDIQKKVIMMMRMAETGLTSAMVKYV